MLAYKHDNFSHEEVKMEMDIRQEEDPSWRLVLDIWLDAPHDMGRFTGKHVLLKTSNLPFNPSDRLEREDCDPERAQEQCKQKFESIEELSEEDPERVASYLPGRAAILGKP